MRTGFRAHALPAACQVAEFADSITFFVSCASSGPSLLECHIEDGGFEDDDVLVREADEPSQLCFLLETIRLLVRHERHSAVSWSEAWATTDLYDALLSRCGNAPSGRSFDCHCAGA